jgi:hypothetical protein
MVKAYICEDKESIAEGKNVKEVPLENIAKGLQV